MITRPSTYAALLVWGATGFMAQPTIASGVVHLFLAPVMLVAVVWLAHREGKRSVSHSRRPSPN